MPVVLALERWRQEDQKLKAKFSYTGAFEGCVRLWLGDNDSVVGHLLDFWDAMGLIPTLQKKKEKMLCELKSLCNYKTLYFKSVLWGLER